MIKDAHLKGNLNWLRGIAIVSGESPLPLMACASKSELRALDDTQLPTVHSHEPAENGFGHGRRAELRLIFNDDHGMTPTVTIVNQSEGVVTLEAVRPAIVSTNNGTYDLDALLSRGPLVVEPGLPLVIHITDIGRNFGEPFRLGRSTIGSEDSDALLDATCRFAS